MDEVDFTVLAAKSVFTDMIDKCPPAETCRDAFDRTARATIKMANSNGGFGNFAESHRLQRAHSNTWGSTPESAGHSAPRHRSRPSEQQPFQFDLSLSDSLSSPSLSMAGDIAPRPSPPVSAASKTFDLDYNMARSAQSPADLLVKQESSVSGGGRQMEPMPPSSGPATNNHNNIMGQHYGGMQVGMEYPDAQMDFLQNLGSVPNSAFGNVDQGQVDLGFGLNWEGLPNEYGEGQQMNPFDTFFFGGQQQGGNGGMGM